MGRFLIRRGFKIYPPFYFFLLVSVLVQYLWLGREIYFFRDAPERIRPLWPELVFMQSYYWGYWNHTWSLAVEEHFYLALPLVLAGLLWVTRRSAVDERPMPPAARRDGPLKPLILVGLVVIGATFLWRTQSTIDYPLAATTNASGQRVGGFHLILHFTRSHMRVDSLLVGVMLGFFYHFHRRATLWLGRALAVVVVPASAVGIASLLGRPLSDPYLLRAGFLVLSASFAGMLWVILSFTQWEPARRVLGSPAAKPLRWLWAAPAYVGMYSYSIYLWHMPMADWGHRLISGMLGLEPYTVASYHARMLSVTVLSAIVGIIAAKVVEFPALRLRDRLFPSLSGAVLGSERPAADLSIPHGTHTHQDLRGPG